MVIPYQTAKFKSTNISGYTVFVFQEGETALLVACWRGYLPIVVMLIKSGANTNAQDQVHDTCILSQQCTYDTISLPALQCLSVSCHVHVPMHRMD